MLIPAASDLETLSDGEVLDLLDLVSNEVKRRNGLRPATAGQAAVDVMRALGDIVASTKK